MRVVVFVLIKMFFFLVFLLVLSFCLVWLFIVDLRGLSVFLLKCFWRGFCGLFGALGYFGLVGASVLLCLWTFALHV